MVFPHKKCMKKYLSKILKNNNQILKMNYSTNPIFSNVFSFRLQQLFKNMTRTFTFLVMFFSVFKTGCNSLCAVAMKIRPLKMAPINLHEYLFGYLQSFQGQHFTCTDTILWLCFYVFAKTAKLGKQSTT